MPVSQRKFAPLNSNSGENNNLGSSINFAAFIAALGARALYRKINYLAHLLLPFSFASVSGNSNANRSIKQQIWLTFCYVFQA